MKEKKVKVNGMKMGAAILETIFAIPVLGAMIIVGFIWIPLFVALAYHIITLVLTHKTRKVTGNVLGIVASSIGWIPFVGWVLHILSAVFCWIETFKEK
jgi:hypothetical protein